MPSIQLSRVDSKTCDVFQNKNVTLLHTRSSLLTDMKSMWNDSVVVIGGTTNAILKMVDTLTDKATFCKKYPQGFQTTTLIVDEASMMVFPHFLALATLVKDDGEIMLAGDHRQLAPIITHDWENGFFVTWYGSLRGQKSAKSLSGKRLN